MRPGKIDDYNSETISQQLKTLKMLLLNYPNSKAYLLKTNSCLGVLFGKIKTSKRKGVKKLSVKIKITTGEEFNISDKSLDEVLFEIKSIKTSESKNFFLYKSNGSQYALDVESIIYIKETLEPDI